MEYFSLRNLLHVGRDHDSSQYAPGVANSVPPASSTIPELPVEILQDIFLEYCTIDIQQYAEDAKRHKRESHMFPPSHPDQLRCRLSLVCRRWASIVKKTPRVWTQLVILDYIPRKATVEQWLTWSEPLPLELLIFLWRPQERILVEELMCLLSSHVSRFRFLMAEFSRLNQFRNILTTYIFPMDQVIYMPVLECLHLRQFFPPPTPPPMGSIISPKLSKLVLLSGYQSGGTYFSGEALECAHLILTHDTAHDFNLLSRTKLLRTLNIGLHESPRTVPDIAFRLEHLGTLKLVIELPSNVFSWDNFPVIFAQLQLPALKLLDISVLGHLSRRDASPLIRSLVFGKSLHVQELACAKLTLGPDFYNILTQLQRLRKLSLLGCTIEETFFKRFIESPNFPADNYLCPGLEEIQLTPCVKFSIFYLEQLLRLREGIVVLITLQNLEMDINDSTALVSLEETYPQFALRVNVMNTWAMNGTFFPVKYLAKAFSMVNSLSKS